jgi:hypothetical protein
MEGSMEVPKKIKIGLPYDSAIPLLDIYLRKCKPGYKKANCTPMFIVAEL